MKLDPKQSYPWLTVGGDVREMEIQNKKILAFTSWNEVKKKEKR